MGIPTSADRKSSRSTAKLSTAAADVTAVLPNSCTSTDALGKDPKDKPRKM
jgi:hypothetical protein